MPDNPFGFDDDEGQISTDPNQTPFANSPEAEPEEPDEETGGDQVVDELPESPLAPAAPPAGEPAAPAPEPSTQTEGVPAPPEGEWLRPGQFRTVEDVLQGYDHVRAWNDRITAEREEMLAQNQEMRGLLQQLQPLLSPTAPPPGPPPQADQLIAQARAQGLDDDTIRITVQLADQYAQYRAAAVRQELSQELARNAAAQAQQRQAAAQQRSIEALRAEADRVAQGFMSAHPELVTGSADHMALQRVLADQRLDFYDPNDQTSLENLTHPAVLEFALEMARDPDLYSVVRATPELWETNEGMERARDIAADIRDKRQGNTAPPAGQRRRTPAVPPAPTGTAPARTPHVERGGSGLAPEQGQENEWGVLKLVRSEKRRSSPLGI